MTQLITTIRIKLPLFYNLIKFLYYLINKIFTGKSRNRIVFEKIYKENYWMDKESVSGSGSNLKNTETLRNELPALINELNIRTLLDVPCGDLNWMKNLDLDITTYIGADIVEELVVRNTRLYKGSNREFILLDITKDNLPAADLILCRDCLPHFSFEDIFASIKKIKESSSTYLLTSTYTSTKNNTDITTGLFRRLNLQLPPFNFPSPLKVISDPCFSEREQLEDKTMALWKIDSIP